MRSAYSRSQWRGLVVGLVGTATRCWPPRPLTVAPDASSHGPAVAAGLRALSSVPTAEL